MTAADASSLKEVVLVAFSSRESDALLAAAWRAKTLQKRPRTAYAPRARQTPKKAKAVDVDLTSDTSEGGASPRAKKSPDDPVDLTNDDGAAPKRKAPDAPASLDLTIDDDDAAAADGQEAADQGRRRRDAHRRRSVGANRGPHGGRGEDDDDDDVQIIERPKEHAKQLQRQLNRFKGRSGGRARSLNEIMRDHERRQSGVIDVDDDAALAQALQAREDTFESDRELARKLEAELNGGPVRMAPSKRKAAPDTSGDAALARRLAEKDRKGRPGQTPSWVGKAKPKDRSPATPEGWAVDDSGLLDVLADQRKSIRSWLATNASGLHIVACDANPHSMPGKPLYNRFVESWQRVPDQTVKLCFHGTAEANIDAICRNGLDPAPPGQAYGPGEYFGAAGNATISVAYCKGGRKMLVFAVLVDKSGLTLDNGSIIVVNKPEYQLPLFVLTFNGRRRGGLRVRPP